MWFPWLLKGTGIPLVCSEHNYPPIISYERWNPYEHFGCLAAADHIHVLLEGYKQFYPAPLQERITVIANSAPKPRFVDWEQRFRKDSRTIIAVGRFVERHKQFLLLIKAFAALEAEFPEWNLVICGDGPDHEACRDTVKTLNLGGRISLPGDLADIDCRYAAADIFCIPSHHEGIPMTVGEAAAHGLPLVGFADCPGVNELIVPGKNGVLAHEMTVEGLVAALRSLMEASAESRQRLGQKAQALMARFDRDFICDQWEELLEKAAAAKGNTALQRLDALAAWTPERLSEAAWEVTNRAYPFRYIHKDTDTLFRRLANAVKKILP
jgi:glycosyltransferase involved in cell wall biosynthesis